MQIIFFCSHSPTLNYLQRSQGSFLLTNDMVRSLTYISVA